MRGIPGNCLTIPNNSTHSLTDVKTMSMVIMMQMMTIMIIYFSTPYLLPSFSS